ncbi:hypothetical protein [Roseomonas sp. CECT 9278]|uniref:hypothetical protein n=1 Tax=Roseomonas sp. CECT 9278 TaxID=2845823 RepID=UPI001E319DCC|nr:hypothetical protein [Roseomonas sp. CECT 9278]CAH0223843.1 hypothetical protein ROS9278_02476 [Roseomonas sp. CECT 9278]
MLAKAIAVSALLALPCIAFAQPAPPALIPAPLQDLPSDDGVMARAERLWSGLMDSFGIGFGTGSSLARGHAMANAHQQARSDFAWLMDIAGYKLKEIESSISLLPSLSLTFGQARELTEADRDYVERMLERHARRNPGPISALQRTIVRGVMDAGELGGFAVDKVEVDLFPLPRVKFQLSPADAPLGVEASRILRAIDRLNHRVQAMARQQAPGGRQTLELPGSTPAPLLPALSIQH